MHQTSDPIRPSILPQDLALFESLAPAIRALSDGQLGRFGKLDPSLRLAKEGLCEVWYTPFDCMNTSAKLTLVGITPGENQLLNALREAREQLRRATPTAEALLAAKRTGAFSGPLRKNLVAMLDHAGVHRWLNIDTTWDLFDRSAHLVHTTSLLRYATFVRDKNYNGAPGMLRNPMLKRLLEDRFCVEAGTLHNTVFLPLGDKVEGVLAALVEQGVLPADRVLPAIPHPSPANVERIQFFLRQKDARALSRNTDPARVAAKRAAIVACISQLETTSH